MAKSLKSDVWQYLQKEDPKKVKCSALDIKLGPEKNESSTSTQPNPSEELRKFQSENQVSHSINPLAWWKENERFYLMFVKSFKEHSKYITSTSTSSERVFFCRRINHKQVKIKFKL